MNFLIVAPEMVNSYWSRPCRDRHADAGGCLCWRAKTQGNDSTRMAATWLDKSTSGRPLAGSSPASARTSRPLGPQTRTMFTTSAKINSRPATKPCFEPKRSQEVKAPAGFSGDECGHPDRDEQSRQFDAKLGDV